MLKNILNLEGAQKLTKNEQKSIKGGITQQCNQAINGGLCHWKTAAGCQPGFEVLTGVCHHINICCESFI